MHEIQFRSSFKSTAIIRVLIKTFAAVPTWNTNTNFPSDTSLKVLKVCVDIFHVKFWLQFQLGTQTKTY